MDWIDGNATLQSASSIAAVIDSARLKYIMPDTVDLIYVLEILDQCRKQNPNIKLPTRLPPILQNISNNSIIRSPLGILINQVPDYLDKESREKIPKDVQFPTEEPFLTAQKWMEGIYERKQKYPEMYQGRKDKFKTQIIYDIQHKNEYFSNRQKYRNAWMKQVLKIDSILKAFNSEIDVGDILEKIDVKNCPSVDLFWKFHEKRIECGKPPKDDNDVDDYMFIPVIPYADIALIEKKFKGFIIQADNS